MSSNEQRRQAAKRKLERQRARRAERARRRRIIAISVSAVAVVIVVAGIYFLATQGGAQAESSVGPEDGETSGSVAVAASSPRIDSRTHENTPYGQVPKQPVVVTEGRALV